MTAKTTAPEDFSGVKITFDKASYTTGDTIKVTLSGAAVLVKPARPMTVTWQIVDPTSGQTTTVSGSAPFTEVDQDSIKANAAPTDDSGHSWVLGADGISATSVA